MPFAAFWLVLAASVAVAGEPEPRAAPPSWSPGGDWVAYVLSTRDPKAALPPGWLLDGWEAPVSPPGDAKAPRLNRLWTSRPATNDHVLLEESRGPLSSPAWAPDGSAIAYVRIVAAEGRGDPAVREVVIQQTAGHPEVVFREELAPEDLDSAAHLNGAAIAWSADGQMLAVPRGGPAGLDILRVENGHRLKVLEGADSPSWSRLGDRLAFFRRRPDGAASLTVLEANLESERGLLEIPDAEGIPGPVWSRDGRSILVALRSRERTRLPGRPEVVAVESAQLVRVGLDGGDPEPLQDLVLQPIAAPDVLRSATFSLGADESHLFFATNTDRQVSQITWAQPEREMIRVRFNPLDTTASLHALALEPEGWRIALRVADAGTTGPVALCDPSTQELTPLVPDDAARAEWLGLLIEATRQNLWAVPTPGDGSVERATTLPAPFELGPDAVGLSNLRRLARVARPLCDRPTASPPAENGFRAALDEARFVFDYLRLDEHGRHYRDASSSLAALEDRAGTPAERYRWLCLRAQVELGLGDRAQARQIVEYLRDERTWPAGRYEETPGRIVLSPTPQPDRAWLDLLEDAARSTATATTGAPERLEAQARLDLTRVPPSPARPSSPAPMPDDGRIDEVEVIVVP